MLEPGTGAAGDVRLGVEAAGDVLLGDAVGDARGGPRIAALEGDADHMGLAGTLHRQPFEEAIDQRRRVARVRRRLGDAEANREPLRGVEGLPQLGLDPEVERVDHRARHAARGQELDLALDRHVIVGDGGRCQHAVAGRLPGRLDHQLGGGDVDRLQPRQRQDGEPDTDAEARQEQGRVAAQHQEEVDEGELGGWRHRPGGGARRGHRRRSARGTGGGHGARTKALP